MRTSLNEIEQVEKYLFKKMNIDESLLFEARMLIHPMLRLNVSAQKKVYSLIKLYHRKKIKEEIEVIHQKLFTDPSKKEFQRSIHQLFKL
ncbi:MAG TPA: hypothetical protein VFW11_04770 [Cyclobacteriaceae bacterium]|nr:hypothetical protein [Cyclobacteriaceae bacterium]